MSKNFIVLGSGFRIKPSVSAPTDPQVGDVYYDAVANTFRLNESTGHWNDIGGVSAQSVSSDITADTSLTYLVDTTADRHITLPPAAPTLSFVVKDASGLSGTHPITIVRHGSELIEGIAANTTLSSDHGAWALVCDGTDWYIQYYLKNGGAAPTPYNFDQTFTSNPSFPLANTVGSVFYPVVLRQNPDATWSPVDADGLVTVTASLIDGDLSPLFGAGALAVRILDGGGGSTNFDKAVKNMYYAAVAL